MYILAYKLKRYYHINVYRIKR